MRCFWYNFLATLWSLSPTNGLYARAFQGEGDIKLAARLDAIDNWLDRKVCLHTPEGHRWAEGPMFQKPSYYLSKLGL